ncbi:hypothetical protein RV11_GL001187 [Enterococcus phoeniculicola]|jgi:hypothetical protein|uniref:Uncharacterized protein n=1 Tax=Enterococcus phoeniculicola ATCC BAA-412 TaxID=1158610 RepID=R3WF53_9ENTE|nr:hypothetical protein [Enterococcus phoeniculicola]EOL46087.1 hypothetical protein UC3_00892 [Enterococcus phoeniculicola ATCC BAA-412]EOT77068.1 hypothetical protein I589_02030 [Enterococcus phoeniculicola ATCC BAA-412]OJG73407.1 hypothetical protein RV11_GL001187 [Enterococcus phoeniculicola]
MRFVAMIIFGLAAINFFYRAVQLFRKSSKISFSENTLHRFICQSCQTEYKLNGIEAKQKIKGAIKIKKSSPKGQVFYYKFTCPNCNTYASQQKLFDMQKSALLGNAKVNIDSNQIPLLIDMLLKGVLPIFIVMILVQLLMK